MPIVVGLTFLCTGLASNFWIWYQLTDVV